MLLFLDSFDDRTSAFQNKYDASANPSGAVSGAARTGNGVNLNSAASATSLTKNFTARATYIVGMAVKPGSATVAIDICALLDGATVQVKLAMTSSGTLQVVNGSGTVLGTSTNTLSASTYVYLELKVTINSTTGSVTLLGDGATWLNLTGINTQNSGAAQATAVRIGSPSIATNSVTYDDYYIADTSGAQNNNFLGTLKIECLRPSAAGTTTQWGIGGTSPAATNWQSVSDTSPDDGTTLVQSSTVNQEDTYTLSDLTQTTGTVVGVQTGFRAALDIAGVRTVAKVLRSGGTDFTGTSKTLSATYTNYYDLDELNPATSAAWSIAAVNALEAGVKVIT